MRAGAEGPVWPGPNPRSRAPIRVARARTGVWPTPNLARAPRTPEDVHAPVFGRPLIRRARPDPKKMCAQPLFGRTPNPRARAPRPQEDVRAAPVWPTPNQPRARPDPKKMCAQLLFGRPLIRWCRAHTRIGLCAACPTIQRLSRVDTSRCAPNSPVLFAELRCRNRLLPPFCRSGALLPG